MRKTLFLLSIAVVSAALYAQTAASPQTSTGAPTPQEVQKAPPVQAASVSAELTKGVDTKHAKVGDELDAKTTAEAKLPDGTVLPKGTKLTGNVVEVAAKSKEQKNSHLVISLNRAVTKDGQDMPIRSAVTSITAPSIQTADLPMNNTAAPAPSGGASASAAPASSAPSNAPSFPTPLSTTQQQTAGTMLKNSTDHVPVGNMPNVVLSAPNTPQSAGVLDGVGENISLQSGTRFTVNVAPAQGGL